MVRPPLVAGTLASLALVIAATTAAMPQARPSERSCVIAWNSPANHANHVRLLAERPILGLMLRPGVVGTDTWTKGSVPTHTSHEACLMTISKRGEGRIVTGIWKTEGVTGWSFGRLIPTSTRLFANVRLLPDGRVTKIYRY